MGLLLDVALCVWRRHDGLAHGETRRLGDASGVDDSLCRRNVRRLLAISCAAGGNGAVISGVGDGVPFDFYLGIGPSRASDCGGLAPQVGEPVIEGKRSQRFTVNPCD